MGNQRYSAAGEFARYYNLRKERTNAFWGDNFHATLVEGGDYLWRCLCYVELDMVRCGVVQHPREWEWLGLHEIMGARQRYRLLDLDQLCRRVRAGSLEDLKAHLWISLEETIAKDELKREWYWTESIAVGSPGFLEQVQPLIEGRQETEIERQGEEVWALSEAPIPYGQKTRPKNACKAPH